MEPLRMPRERLAYPIFVELWALQSVTGLTTATQTSSSLIGYTKRTHCLKIFGIWVTNQRTPAACSLATSLAWLVWARFLKLPLVGGPLLLITTTMAG